MGSNPTSSAVKTLGIDYGTKKVGIAISDEGGTMAFPYGVFPNDNKLTTLIQDLCKKENINTVVLGESLDFNGQPNPVMKKILSFKKTLEEKFSFSVFLEKEFLTSKQARNIQEDSSLTDASAAAIILQSWLDKQKKV
ncbi:MAG: Holliday junction resolvase RuvX [Candidatus Parcubacteria bacterium]|nr:Holliday junction resolvase RuvX [Candidatus Parcubacteria bacterium]